MESKIVVIKMTDLERKNLLAFLTGEDRVSIKGNEAFEFVSICNKIAKAEEEKEVREEEVDGE